MKRNQICHTNVELFIDCVHPSLWPSGRSCAATSDFPSFSKQGPSHSWTLFFADPRLFSMVRIDVTISANSANFSELLGSLKKTPSFYCTRIRENLLLYFIFTLCDHCLWRCVQRWRASRVWTRLSPPPCRNVTMWIKLNILFRWM